MSSKKSDSLSATVTTLVPAGANLRRKLKKYQEYFNDGCVHYSLNGKVPSQKAGEIEIKKAEISNYRWNSYCHGRFQVPAAA